MSTFEEDESYFFFKCDFIIAVEFNFLIGRER